MNRLLIDLLVGILFGANVFLLSLTVNQTLLLVGTLLNMVRPSFSGLNGYMTHLLRVLSTGMTYHGQPAPMRPAPSYSQYNQAYNQQPGPQQPQQQQGYQSYPVPNIVYSLLAYFYW